MYVCGIYMCGWCLCVEYAHICGMYVVYAHVCAYLHRLQENILCPPISLLVPVERQRLPKWLTDGLIRFSVSVLTQGGATIASLLASPENTCLNCNLILLIFSFSFFTVMLCPCLSDVFFHCLLFTYIPTYFSTLKNTLCAPLKTARM